MRSRVVVVGGGFVLLVALVTGLGWWFGVRHEGGPLAGAAAGQVCLPAKGSKDFTQTVMGVHNKAGQDARITGVTLLGSDGLRLADSVLVRRGNFGFGTEPQWPPPDTQLVWSGRVQAIGGRVPVAANADEYWDLVLHLQATDDRAVARLDGIRIDYASGTRRFQVTDTSRFVVVRTGGCQPGDFER